MVPGVGIEPTLALRVLLILDSLAAHSAIVSG